MLRFDLSYVYNGAFSPELVTNILSLAEANMDTMKEVSKVKKKVYFILVESLQNITRHKEETDKEQFEESSFFIIQHLNNDYYITSCNPIENTKIADLKGKLDTINGLKEDELKEYQTTVLSQGEFSDKGGGGLGLIEMARKSKNKLNYDFTPIDEKFSYFYFQLKIKAMDSTEINQEDDILTGLNAAKSFHNLIVEKKLNLVYQGDFSQENVKSVLSMTERNIGEAEKLSVRKKVFNTIVELLQNIYKHAPATDNTDGKSGIFLISRDKGFYELTAGNLISNDKVEVLKKNLNLVNQLSVEELDELYTKVLLEEEKPEDKGAGLGLIDMRIKSGNNIAFDFNPVNEQHSFFTMQIKISE